jgi:hypothetical protein
LCRYVALYREWLQAIGWGEDEAAKQARQRAEKQQPREAQRLKSRLQTSLRTAEESLPLEAVVVARTIARAHLTTRPQVQNGGDTKGFFLSLYRGGGSGPALERSWADSGVYKRVRVVAMVLYAVLWGLLSTLWTIVASPYNGFVAATRVIQKPPEGDPFADDDVTPAELTSATKAGPAGAAPPTLALSVSFHVGAGSVTLGTSSVTSAAALMTSGGRVQASEGEGRDAERKEAQAVRLTWSRFSLAATQSAGANGGAYLARVTLGSVDCNCVSLLPYNSAFEPGKASEAPALDAASSGGFLATIFGLERSVSEGVQVDEEGEGERPRWAEGPGGNVPLFISGFAPEWKTSHPKPSSKLLGMGAFCNRGIGRGKRTAGGTGGLLVPSLLG